MNLQRINLSFVILIITSLILSTLFTQLSSAQAASSCEDLFAFGAARQPRGQETPFEADLILAPVENLKNFAASYGLTFEKAYIPQGITFPLEFADPHYPLKPGAMIPGPVLTRNGLAKRAVIFDTKDAKANAPKVLTAPVFKDDFIHDPGLRGEIWKNKSESFWFANLGTLALKNSASDSEITQAAIEAGRKNPGAQIEIPINPRWAKAMKVMTDRQNWATTHATENYAARKPYLNAEDLYDLREHDYRHSNDNDYMMLFRDTGKSPLLMKPQEFQEQLAVMLRVARHNVSISDFEALYAGGTLFQDLPHQDRLPHAVKPLIKSLLDQLAEKAGLQIAELSRFNRFSEVSEQMMDQFVLSVFETVQRSSKPVDLFILESDEITRRLFAKRYKFKLFTKISVDSASEPRNQLSEYLMFLDTRSDEYREMIASLRAKAQGVEVRMAPPPPPIEKWVGNWPEPPGFWNGSVVSKWKQSEATFATARQNVARSHQPKALPWRSLSTERPATAQRAEQIAVVSLRDGLARSLLEQASQRLSFKERQELASQLLLYSDAWKLLFNYLFLTTRGEESVTVVGRLSEVLSAAFHQLYPEARVTFTDPADFFKQRLAPESQDKVILLHELSRIQEGSRASAREQKNLIEASFRALKRNRHLLIVDAGSLFSTNRKTGQVSSPEDEAKLLAREAYGRGLPLSEQELALAIYLLKDDIRAVAQAALSGDQIITNARGAGFAVDRWGGFGTRSHNRDKDLFSGIDIVKP